MRHRPCWPSNYASRMPIRTSVFTRSCCAARLRSRQPAASTSLATTPGYWSLWEPARWGQTLRSMLWTIANVVVPPFTGSTVVDLQVPCTYDFNRGRDKILLCVGGWRGSTDILFSGTVFYATEQGALQVAQIPWDRESVYRLPVQVWKEMMELYYPNTGLDLSAKGCIRSTVSSQTPRWRADLGAIDRALARRREEVPS